MRSSGCGEREISGADVKRLIEAVDNATKTPGGLESSPDVALLRHKGREAMYLVRAGTLRAVLIKKDAGRPEDAVVVANVYGRDEEEIGGSLSGPHEAPVAARAG